MTPVLRPAKAHYFFSALPLRSFATSNGGVSRVAFEKRLSRTPPCVSGYP